MNGPTKGFTLIEVLVALAIFAGAALVLGATYVNILNGYAFATRATLVDEEVRFARDQLYRETDPDEVEQGSEYQTTDGRFVRWRAEVEPTTVADLFEVVFICEIEGGAGEPDRTVEESFRLLRPTWSEDVERDRLRAEARDRITEYLERRP